MHWWKHHEKRSDGRYIHLPSNGRAAEHRWVRRSEKGFGRPQPRSHTRRRGGRSWWRDVLSRFKGPCFGGSIMRSGLTSHTFTNHHTVRLRTSVGASRQLVSPQTASEAHAAARAAVGGAAQNLFSERRTHRCQYADLDRFTVALAITNALERARNDHRRARATTVYTCIAAAPANRLL